MNRAIDEVKSILDKRGIVHIDDLGIIELVNDGKTVYRVYRRPNAQTVDVAIISATPQQAIEALDVRRECRFNVVERFAVSRRLRADRCRCDVCGYECARGFIEDENFKYCPGCGMKIAGVIGRNE